MSLDRSTPRSTTALAIAVGVVALTPFGWGGFVVLPFWVAWVSVMHYRAQRRSGTVATAGSPA